MRLKETKQVEHIDGGSDTYWRQQREGFRLINAYQRRKAIAEGSPTYYGSSYNAEGEVDGITENTNPWDRAHEAAEQVAIHPGARRIIRAWGLKIKTTKDGYEYVVNKNGRYPNANEIPVFGSKHK